MGQRTLQSSQAISLEMDQQGLRYLHPESAVLLGTTTAFPQPHFHMMPAASGSRTNTDAHYLPEHYEGATFYGRTQFNGAQQHHHGIDFSATTPGSLYYSPSAPSSGATALPVPLNHAVSEELPSSSNYGAPGISSDDYRMSNQVVDDFRGPWKRKIAEGIPVNLQYSNGSASSSTSVPVLNTRQPDGGALIYQGNSTVMIEMGPQSFLRNRSGANGLDSIPVQDHNNLPRRNYVGQHMQQSGNNVWNRTSAMPYMHGNSSGGLLPLDSVNIGVPRYHERAGIRNSTSIRHPSSSAPWLHSHHYPSPPLQGVGACNINFHPQVAGASYRIPLSSAPSTLSSRNGLEMGHRQPGPVPLACPRVYHPHHGGVVPEASLRQRNLPHLRFLQADEIALLEIPDIYEMGSYVDHYRDMRLDIDDMSYEELLALEEQIGRVNTGLSEETIASQLKTRTFVSSTTLVNPEKLASLDAEGVSCIICLDVFHTDESIGILDCGHNYHADCLKKWLLIKNACPICKSEALPTRNKDL